MCPLSGGAPGPGCTHVVRRVAAAIPTGRVLAPCTMHERVADRRRNGLRAGPGCASSVVEERDFERFDGRYRAWARDAGRPTAPTEFSPLCGRRPGAQAGTDGDRLRIGYPQDGARFILEPDRPLAQQSLMVRVEAKATAGRVDLRVDGRVVSSVGSPYVTSWQLTPGEHVLVAEGRGMTPSAPVRIEVD